MPAMVIRIVQRIRKQNEQMVGYCTHCFYRRHLLRHWLHPDNAWKLPPQLESTWDKIYHQEREEIFPLEATVRII